MGGGGGGGGCKMKCINAVFVIPLNLNCFTGTVIVVDCFYIALFSALKQSPCALVAFDSK